MTGIAVANMKRAVSRVSEIAGEPYAKEYGGICHKFPVMVRSCGLAQAVAFSAAKAAADDGNLAKAHRRLVDDVRDVLEIESPAEAPQAVVDHIANLDVVAYVVATRRVLKAWIYYKRFAVSILKRESAQDAEDQ